ncbi:MAG TPA: prepilin-type N-terminal cleavage/methylation domain-containing protein [Candidatus Krumholzibacteria bacterium]|nr:prepilin-type N-terminal cleavage/methylation domain-containing protein [Candidatus Krumholzibacteria bacterium]
MVTKRVANAHHRQEGFSLVELMVALVILTIGLLPLAFVQTRAQQDVFDSGRYTEAITIATLQMEETKSLGFGVAVTDTGTVDNYTWVRDVQSISPTLDQITVSVSWTERGTPRLVQIINRLSDR